ncbi:MAG: hypothetical protein AAFX01_07150 [Cyanobacteria bacterium J06638_28]
MKSSPFKGSAASWPIIRFFLLLGCLAIGLSAWAGYRQDDLLHYFDEDSILNWLSGLQLLAVAIIAGAIYSLRRQQQTSWRSPQLLWLLVTIGFVFLAADELAWIHESIDLSIHRTWQLEETGLTDRIDDVIVGAYGAVAAMIAYGFRHEIKRYRHLWPLILCGFGVTCLMLVFDTLTNHFDILPMLFGRASYALHLILSVAEEFCKLVVQSILIGSFYQVFWIEKQAYLARHADPATQSVGTHVN